MSQTRKLPVAILAAAVGSVIAIPHLEADVHPPVHRSSPASQPRTGDWILASRASVLEAIQFAESGDPVAPFDVVVLRMKRGTSVTDCGVFERPSIMDNGVERRWVYRATRPVRGACAPVVGDRFLAAGRKGIAERVTEPVP